MFHITKLKKKKKKKKHYKTNKNKIIQIYTNLTELIKEFIEFQPLDLGTREMLGSQSSPDNY